MPGITGFISKAPMREGVLDQMVASMTHEPSYTFGKYVNRGIGLHVGWVCHSGSFSDCMPIWNETGDACIVFSGEEFMDLSEVRRLSGAGQECHSDNATYLIHLYETLGLRFIERLNGWFSGLVVDFRMPTVVLFNDRYGLSRVYYHENAEGFYFSSEAKALLKVLPDLRQLDPKGLAETVSCGCVLQDRTLFAGIFLLPGGSRWEFGPDGRVNRGKYFRSESWEGQPSLTEAEFYAELKETFARILPRYFRGPNAVGMSLTGGLDGRMIMAWANRPPGALPCYSFGSAYRDCADVTIARRIAELCGQSHETIPVGQQFLSDFRSLAEKAVFVSDGAMDVTGSVELYVNRVARQVAPVRLTGNYGSEILRGNVALRPGRPDRALFSPEVGDLLGEAAGTYAREREGNRLSFIAFKQVPWHHYPRLSVEQSQLTLRSPYLDNELVSLMFRAPSELGVAREPSLRLMADGSAELGRIPTDRGVLYRARPIVGKLRHALTEAVIKAEYAYDYGMPRQLLRADRLLSALHLERLFLGRHKFYHFRIWYRDQLRDYVRDVLLDPRSLTRSCISKRGVERAVKEHIGGEGNHTLAIHRLLTLELTQRKLIEGWA